MLASDATERQIAAKEMDDPSNQEIQIFHDNILVNELKAAMLSLDLASQRLDDACFDSFISGEHLAKSQMAARLYIDNNAVISMSTSLHFILFYSYI